MEPELWTLDHLGHRHEVTVRETGLSKVAVWSRDGVEVARKKTGDSTVVLVGGDDRGAVRLKLPSLVGPTRRVTLHPGDATVAAAAAHAGTGGIDLDPEPGSKAAQRIESMVAHPTQYAIRRGLSAAAGVVVPIVLFWAVTRYLLPPLAGLMPNVDLPSLPLPDINLPSIPFPDINLPNLPGWLEPVVKYAGPVAIAVALAVGETRRRSQQEPPRAADASKGADDESSDSPEVGRPQD